MKITVFLLLIAGVYGGTASESNTKDAIRVERNSNKGDSGKFRGTAGVDYPDLREIPTTNFLCSEQQFEGGLYADVETQCQVYHVCHDGRKDSFLCGKGTIFNQQILACDYWYSTECDTAPSFYYVNAEIGKQNGNYQPPAEHDISRIHNANKGDQGRNFQPPAGSSVTGGNRQPGSQPAAPHGNRQQSFQPAGGSNRQPGRAVGGSNYGHGNRQPSFQPEGGSNQQPGFQPPCGFGQGNQQPCVQPSDGSDYRRGDSNGEHGDNVQDFQPSGGNVGRGLQPSGGNVSQGLRPSVGNVGRGFQPPYSSQEKGFQTSDGNQGRGFQPSRGGQSNQGQGFQTSDGSRRIPSSQNPVNNPNFQPVGHSNREYGNQGGRQRPGSSNQGHGNEVQSPDNQRQPGHNQGPSGYNQGQYRDIQGQSPDVSHDSNCHCMKVGYQTRWSFPKFPGKVK